MRFHYKIMLLALVVAAVTAGALPGARGGDLADPGYWMALGQSALGTSENGWCSCL